MPEGIVDFLLYLDWRWAPLPPTVKTVGFRGAFSMSDDEKWQRRLYEIYQLHWLMKHGHSLNSLMHELDRNPECHDPYIYNYANYSGMHANIEGIYEDWEHNYGFGGDVWACYEEFCAMELQNETYINTLAMFGLKYNEMLACMDWYLAKRGKNERI